MEPWRRLYPPEAFPSLWDSHLPGLIASGELRATQEVLIELKRQDDEILQWARSQPGLFVEVDESLQTEVTSILKQFRNLVDADFGRSGADPFVIALARLNGCAVVTQEGPRSRINPRIPDVCGALKVPCIKILDVILAEGWRFT